MNVIYKSKTTCFTFLNDIPFNYKDSFFKGKTSCFGVTNPYDTIIRRIR